MKSGNIFESIPEEIDVEIFDLLIQRNNIKVERIISKGHSSPKTGWYDQDHNEWVIVLKGEATITIEGNIELNLKVGSYVDIPTHTKHKVSWTKPNSETIWLAIHY